MRAYDDSGIAVYQCDRCNTKLARDIKDIWRLRMHNISKNGTSRDFDLCDSCAHILKSNLTNEGRVPVL